MRFRLKFAVAAIAVAALLGVGVATAMAAAVEKQSVALQVGDEQGTGYTASYGDEVVLAPAAMSKIELPGDVFQFQVLVRDIDASGNVLPDMVWKTFQDFEDVKLEDTNTVQPFGFRVGMDDSVILSDGSSVKPVFPYTIRCEYKPGGSSTVAVGTTSTPDPTYSETETVNLIKHGSTAVYFSQSGAARLGGTAFRFQVSPNCGVGTVRVTVTRKGYKTLTYNLTTDENGYVYSRIKLGSKRGTYRVSARFLGNVYGAASGTSGRNVTAIR